MTPTPPTVRVCAISGHAECEDCARGTCDGLRYKPFWMTRDRLTETTREAA